MVTILLEQILELLKGWLSSFTSWAEDTAEKLGLIEEATEYIDDIFDETTQIQANTSNIATSNTMIQGYSLNISNKTNNIDTNVTAIKNNVGSIATSSGAAAAFAEDIATNTLNIDNRLVTIGSDTTQLKSNSNAITADVSDIKSMLNYFSYGLIVTEDIEGSICSFDTDLIDYIQNLKVNIKPDNSGFSSVNITRTGKNLFNSEISNYINTSIQAWGDNDTSLLNFLNSLPEGVYTFSYKIRVDAINGTGTNQYGIIFNNSQSGQISTRATESTINVGSIFNRSTSVTITASNKGLFTNCWFYTGRSPKANADNCTFYDMQLELGSKVTDFEPYKGNTYNISLGATVTDGGELNALTGVLKVNTTPPTYSVVDPIAVKTFKGINNIWADTGNSMVTYKETLKHKIDKEA